MVELLPLPPTFIIQINEESHIETTTTNSPCFPGVRSVCIPTSTGAQSGRLKDLRVVWCPSIICLKAFYAE
jgi:hypothetical protein